MGSRAGGGDGGGSEVNSVAQFAPGAKYDRGFWRYAFVVGGAAPGGEGAGGMAGRAGIGGGGAAGANGSGGTLYRMSTATFGGTADADTTITLAAVPTAVKYDVIFNGGGYAGQSASSVVLGVAVTNCIAAADVPVPTRFGKTFLGWYTEENGAGTKWFNADGSVANAPEIYETIGSTTLYAAWRDEDVAQWRVNIAGIEVGSGSVVLTLKAGSAEKFAEAKKHLHVYASPTLPVPETADAIIAAPEIVDNGDGTGTATFPLDPNLGAQFYEIGVGASE